MQETWCLIILGMEFTCFVLISVKLRYILSPPFTHSHTAATHIKSGVFSFFICTCSHLQSPCYCCLTWALQSEPQGWRGKKTTITEVCRNARGQCSAFSLYNYLHKQPHPRLLSSYSQAKVLFSGDEEHWGKPDRSPEWHSTKIMSPLYFFNTGCATFYQIRCFTIFLPQYYKSHVLYITTNPFPEYITAF